MPTTPNYALPYPTLSDSADVPRDIEALADRLDLVIPAAFAAVGFHKSNGAGGSINVAGQVLVFPTSDYDPSSIMNGTTGKLTCPRAGLLVSVVTWRWAAVENLWSLVAIRKNNTAFKAAFSTQPGTVAGIAMGSQAVFVMPVAANDVVDWFMTPVATRNLQVDGTVNWVGGVLI